MIDGVTRIGCWNMLQLLLLDELLMLALLLHGQILLFVHILGILIHAQLRVQTCSKALPWSTGIDRILIARLVQVVDPVSLGQLLVLWRELVCWRLAVVCIKHLLLLSVCFHVRVAASSACQPWLPGSATLRTK